MRISRARRSRSRYPAEWPAGQRPPSARQPATQPPVEGQRQRWSSGGTALGSDVTAPSGVRVVRQSAGRTDPTALASPPLAVYVQPVNSERRVVGSPVRLHVRTWPGTAAPPPEPQTGRLRERTHRPVHLQSTRPSMGTPTPGKLRDRTRFPVVPLTDLWR